MGMPLLATLLLLLCWSGHGALFAVDVGSQFLKIALLNRPTGKLQIVLDDGANRKTPATVGFWEEDEPVFGTGAIPLLSLRPHTTFMNIHQLLGLPFEHRMIDHVRNVLQFPYAFGNNTARGTGDLSSGNTSRHAEEIMALLLQHAQQLVQEHAGPSDAAASIKQCVLVVPAYYSILQRKALVQAAKLAKLQPIGLIHRTTAAAVQYSTQLAASAKGKQLQTFVLVDVGDFSTEIGIFRLQTGYTTASLGTLTTKAITWHTEVGGSMYDRAIGTYFLEQFREQTGVALEDDGTLDSWRALRRLAAEAKSVKEKLSANTVIPVVIEGLYEKNDFRLNFTRSLLEDLTQNLTDSILETVRVAFKRAKVKKTSLKSVCIVGGGTRMPILQEKLKQLFDMELDRSLNSDEASVLGAVLSGATQIEMDEEVGVGSKRRKRRMKRKGITVEDPFSRTVVHYTVQPYPRPPSDTSPVLKTQVLVDSTRQKDFVTVNLHEDFQVTLWDLCSLNVADASLCLVPDDSKGTSPVLPADAAKIGKFRITGGGGFFKQMKAEGKGTGVTELRLTHNEITSEIGVQAAVAIWRPAAKKETSSTKSKSKTAKEKEKEKAKNAPKKVLLNVQKVAVLPKSLEGAEFRATELRLQKLQKSLQTKRDIAHAKHQVESEIYAIRSEWLEGERLEPEKAAELQGLVEELEQWLVSVDNARPSAAEYRKKRRELKENKAELVRATAQETAKSEPSAAEAEGSDEAEQDRAADVQDWSNEEEDEREESPGDVSDDQEAAEGSENQALNWKQEEDGASEQDEGEGADPADDENADEDENADADETTNIGADEL